MPVEGSHRWSGWPGAWCLDCGAEDAREVCLAGIHRPEQFRQPETDPLIGDHTCLNDPCPEPGSNRHNPYQEAR